MNTDICKLLYPSRIYCFLERRLYTQKISLADQVSVVMLFWAQKRIFDAKYSTRVCEMKSLTYSLLPIMN